MTRPRRSNIGRKTRQSRSEAQRRANETEQQNQRRLNIERQRSARSRSRRSNENRANENQVLRRQTPPRSNLEFAAFNYDSTVNYSLHRSVQIGMMNKVCPHCAAFKFENETMGLCCASGKVKLEPVKPPPEPLHSLLSGQSLDSRHFLDKIQTYNSLFQMTSFGATNIIKDNFMPTFKVITSNGVMNSNECETINVIPETFQIQGQVYHNAGSLLPLPDQNHQFLQIYFIGNAEDEVSQRCHFGTNIRRHIVEEIQRFLHQNNRLVHLFQTALQRMPSDNHKIIIRADKMPAGEHAGRFNTPTIDEVAIIIVGEGFQPRDIVLHRCSGELQRVSETHRCYDALQYPLLFWDGQDGYHLNIKMINPSNGVYKLLLN